MPSIETRECPQCHVVKPFRKDAKTCGCPKPPVEKLYDETSSKGNVRNIRLDATRICNEEQLIEALAIDLDKWYIDTFVVRKWEMGYIASTHKREYPKPVPPAAAVKDSESATTERAEDRTTAPSEEPKHTYVENEADHHALFAVSAKLKRVVTEKDNEGFVKDNVKLLKENKRVRFQLDAERRYNKQLIQTQGLLDESLAQLGNLVDALTSHVDLNPTQRYTVATPQITPAVSPNHNEDAVALFSDWHFGDVIRPGDTSGFPEFDLSIAGNRLGYVVSKICGILTKHRAMYPIKKLTIWFGGDMGNGDLHDAPLSNALFIGPQIDFTFRMAVLALVDLIALTEPDANGIRVIEELEVLFTCGNHMRESTAKFMPMKYQAVRTFDWLIYRMLMHWMDQLKNPRVKYEEGMSPYIFKNIRGHRYGFAHGMQVGYKNSPDAQCKTMDGFLKTIRSLFDSPEFRRRAGLTGATFSRMCIGDIHVPVDFPRITSNASLNGQNELGANWGLEPIPAGQKLFGVSDKHIQTWGYLVECSQIQKDPQDWNRYGHEAADYERRYGRR